MIGYKATRSASATRTDTALHETPQSISVVPSDVLQDTAATRLQDGLDYAGGVGRANNFGGQGLTTFTVRGFTTGEFYRNGFPINRGYPNAPDANTVERLEILRGPATSLYGRGDPGGTFNVVSKQPLADPKVTLGSQFDDQGMHRATLDATGPLDEEGRLAYRLNVLGEGGETFRDDVQTERYDVAPVLSWQVNDTTRIVFEGDFMRNNHPLDRGLTRFANQRDRASRDTNVWEKAPTTCCTTTTTWPSCASSISSTRTGPWAVACSGSTARSRAMRWKPMNCKPMAVPSGAISAIGNCNGPIGTTSST